MTLLAIADTGITKIMEPNVVFNATVCILGIGIFLIHSIDMFLKRGKRKDEIALLGFFLFTAIHFSVYLAFIFIHAAYTSNALIMGFYTSFYIMNNLEMLFLFLYATIYIAPRKKIRDMTFAIHYSLLGIFIFLDILNLFPHFFFYGQNGAYVRAPLMFLSQGYQLVTFAMVFILAVTDKKLGLTEKIAFGLYCTLPLIAIILQNLMPGYAIAYLSTIVAIEILFLFANQRKNAILVDQARKNKDAEIRIMTSQIQPHFIYNSLSSISTLIKVDPDKAEKTLDNFTEYLRKNLSMLSKTRNVLFNEELKHVELYLSLEKVRFEERLTIVYDIQSDDFYLPPLSVQPIVENAIKHGILKKEEGGTVTIKTYATKDNDVVEIIDDGVGFDPSVPMGQEHVGLANVSHRIATMCQGEMKVESQIGEGTRVTMIFPKGGNTE